MDESARHVRHDGMDLWRRWRAGDSISVIFRALGEPPGSFFTVLKHHGSIAPADRVCRADRLTAEDRESISRDLEAGASLRSIAVSIGRAVSTVSREVTRSGSRVNYRTVAAEQRAEEHTRRPKPSACRTPTSAISRLGRECPDFGGDEAWSAPLI
ncbi:helix-turn-helix domain-containing protein [Micromonospora sp. NBC_01699]|uniref:helix-turn-helix domain-containing protein n=1 Tax=Micromonospora sp. NBC_01699 TaxID=2975984 RepID=UPI002E2872CB|nr:helix-turn-helix domain-containing protein [Micromonospora sp. NBC_01699]